MTRLLLAAAAFLAIACACWPDEAPPSADTIIHLNVQPAPAPKPALRYLLFPELGEMNPGNPVQGYMKSVMEPNNFFHSKEALDEREKLENMPLKDFPAQKLRDYGGMALRQADYAARLDTVDWQVLPKLKADGIYLLVPEVQPLRSLSAALKVRFRGEIAAGRFDDALVTAKTMFAMAHHLGEHPTLIGNLVGVAIASMTLEPIEEMLQQPGCPNLYWALTQLPQPLVGFRKALEGERMMLSSEFALLTDKESMSAAQLEKAVNRLDRVFHDILRYHSPRERPQQSLRAWLEQRRKDEDHVRAARKRLLEHGLAKDKIDQFPLLQILLLDGKLAYEVSRDEILKGRTLPYWQVKPPVPGTAPDESPFTLIVPGVFRRQAQTRLEQRIGLLRCVEALRIYAAEHGGKLPNQLADIKLPLPVDPFTGKDFVYEWRGSTAALRGALPHAPNRLPGLYNGHYEVTMRK